MKLTTIIISGFIILILFVGYFLKARKQSNNQSEILIVDDKPVLKQFIDLKQSDFDKFPVWVQCHIIDYEEEWYDNTDEETFRPWINETPIQPNYAMFLVKAEFILNNGKKYNGFITSTKKTNNRNENDLGSIQPHIFMTDNKIVGFWTGMFPYKSEKIVDIYDSFNLKSDQIFPISFQAMDGLSKGVNNGIINGFLTINNGEINIIK